CRRIRRRQHMATPVKNSARVDHHTRRMYLPGHHSLRLNLHAPLGEDYPIEPPRDHHPVPFYLAFNLGVLSKHDRLLRNNIAFHMPVNPKRSGECQRAFQRYSLVDEPGPFFARAILRRARPLPSHENTPRQYTTNLARRKEKSTPLADRVVEYNPCTMVQ